MPAEPDRQMRLFNPDPPERTRATYEQVRDVEPLSGRQDPVGSFEAAGRMKATGLAGKQRLAVYHGLRVNQGVTSAELARDMACDRHAPARRLPELERAGWVCRGRRRRCSVTGIQSETWFIARPWLDADRHKATAEGR